MPISNDQNSFLIESESQAESEHFALEFAAKSIGAPPDWPHKAMAIHGLCKVLTAIEEYNSKIHVVHLNGLRALSSILVGQKSQRNLLFGRSSAHRLYLCILELERPRKIVSIEVEKSLLLLVGHWVLIKFLTNRDPQSTGLNLVRKALATQDTQSFQGALTRAISKASEALRKAAIQQPEIAVQIGHSFSESKEKKEARNFDEELARNIGMRLHFSSKSGVQGTLGHNSLTSESLLSVGRFLQSRVSAGDEAAIGTCLQVLTRFTRLILQLMPVALGDHQPAALAWLNVDAGSIYVRPELFSPKPRSAWNEVLVNCVQISPAQIVLPHFLQTEIRKRKSDLINKDSVEFGKLFIVEDINPRSSLYPSPGHLITLSRIQETICASALNAGNHRWPVAVSTFNLQLVARGRRAYSVVSSKHVHKACASVYRALGWEENLSSPTNFLFGSALTPRPESITRAAEFLDGQCLKATSVTHSFQLNHWATRTSFLCALALALRRRNVYPLDYHRIARSETVHVNDKDIHFEENKVPVASHLRVALAQWNCAVSSLIRAISNSEYENDVILLQAIQQLGIEGRYPVFSIVGGVALEPAGTKTWFNALPSIIKLAENFGRHFWPQELEKLGLTQRHVDLLMRHQTTYVQPYKSGSTAIKKADEDKLRRAIEQTFTTLLPAAYQGGNDE